MNALAIISNEAVTMTSLELVEFINSQRGDGESELRHDHFMAKVAQVLGEIGAPKFRGTYRDIQNKERPCYRFPKREACLMAMSYSYDIQAKVFDRMTALENKTNAIAIPNFSNPAQAARAWAEQYEARLIAESTKAEIGSRREATAMNTASQAVKQVAKLEIELDKSAQYATIKRMGMLYHGQEFNYRLLRSASNDIGMPARDVFDANYGTVKAYHANAWREAYALEINPLSEVVAA